MTINLLKIKLSREPAQGVKQNPRRLETSRKTQTWFLACPQKSFTVLRFCSHIITFHKHTIIGVWLKSCWTRFQVAPVKLRAAGRWGGEQDLRARWEFFRCDCSTGAHVCLQALPASCSPNCQIPSPGHRLQSSNSSLPHWVLVTISWTAT